jgi:DNA-binding XRE family transcriptional regulator
MNMGGAKEPRGEPGGRADLETAGFAGAGGGAVGAPGMPHGAPREVGVSGSVPGAAGEVPGAAGEVGGGPRVPVMPGFREMALRRMSQDRGRLMRELAARRQETGLSQTEVAARMGTSQSAVARLESGEADVRTSTLERYAAALGTEITWKLQG